MKLFAFFLSTIVLGLTLIPCCALDEVSEVHSIEIGHKISHSCDDRCSDCSPFYVCGACVGFSLNIVSAITFGLQAIPVQHKTLHIHDELPKSLSSIWQPPKLS
ncbi:DUF6660 family protein [Arcticibacter svalbardensis]|uniref:DUF6660 family protein n=1 Tax=Arcticibacter svalbardensis TaxID=1288027 RepID=UPI00373FDDC0